MNKNQLIVIADDITGAAEIAGIGHRHGLRVNLIMYKGEKKIVSTPPCDLIVIATDTRSMTQSEAIEETQRVAHLIKGMKCTHIFKKTDSILRGYVYDELKTLMSITGIEQTWLLPQNPSRGRIIKNGIYYIDETPLDKTGFARDPEFPAPTAETSILLFHTCRGQVLYPLRKIREKGIDLVEATTEEEVKQHAKQLPKGALAAGGADFFSAWLDTKGYTEKPREVFEGIKNKQALIVLGKTFSQTLSDTHYIRSLDISHHKVGSYMFYRAATKKWINKLIRNYAAHDSFILCVDQPVKRDEHVAIKLREEVGKAVEALLSERLPKELIIEGGATAFSILKRTGWNTFGIACEACPGVIRMVPVRYPDITITVKPGSYPWGGLFE